MRGVAESSPAWNLFLDYDPDIALLQEVTEFSKKVQDLYEIKIRKAVRPSGGEQRFGTAVLVKGKIIEDLPLRSEHDWVNKQLEHFAGNLISCVAQVGEVKPINIISAYSPAWPVDTKVLDGIDVSSIKLKQNPDVWVTEILWSALKNARLDHDTTWIIGGDLNSSETFDEPASRGNDEVLQRMKNLGLVECLREYIGKLVPTFRNPRDGRIDHQLDHLFVTNNLYLKN